MNILVTGSSGYMGSNFINTFSSKYNFVKFSLLRDTLSDLEINNVDVVLHCAALVHQKIEHDYEKYDDVNVKYPVTLAKKAKENGVKQFVLLSTIAVYGEKEILDENTLCEPATAYGKSKLEAEKQLEALQDENFTVSIVRPPMVYGNDAPGNIKSLIKLIKKIPILPFAKINNKRSFVYIGNLCHLIDAVIKKRAKGVFLAADDRPISTTELIALIAKASNKNENLIKIPFFETLLKSVKPGLHKRLYRSLEVDNSLSMETLFGDTKARLPYSVEEGIAFMIVGEEK